MTISDPISDLLTRIRNAQRANKENVKAPASKQAECLLQVLADEGYIRGFLREKGEGFADQLKIELKYFDGLPVIKLIDRVSKPGRRVYSSIKELPLVRNGLGINILNTSHGVMSDARARKEGIGGEVICAVF
ncbi:MAG: 30S ribosomal protein S8 [Alphaproteobacteria bacterium]|nr:30S ribosomal protein S8 [Alphaproteobacteria bacterium]